MYRSTIEQDLQAWQKLREQRGLEAKKGPMIDPASYGGYQGAYAPEWRQFTPPSPRPVSLCMLKETAVHKGLNSSFRGNNRKSGEVLILNFCP